VGSFRSASSVSIRSVVSAGALIAAATLFAPPGSKAQTLAELDVGQQRQRAMAQCDGITDSNKRGACRQVKSMEFDDARIVTETDRAAKARAEAAADRAAREKAEATIAQGQCARDLSGAILDQRVTRDEVLRAKTTPSQTSDLCEVKRRLQPRLGQLSQQ
jgi:hypothetical protein